MKQCEFCGAGMADTAEFCGKCGRVPSQTAQRPTRISDLSTIELGHVPDLDLDDENQTILSASGKHMIPRSPSGVLRPLTLVPIDDDDKEEDEEEKRKRAVFFGMGLPLLDEVANAPTMNQVPTLAGTPPINQAPVLSGTPPIQGNALFGAGNAAPQPLPQSYQPPPHVSPPPVQSPGGLPQRPPNTTPTGCLPVGAVLLAALLIILATVFGLSLTVFAPSLSLGGKSVIQPGGVMTLHGQHFLPNSSITLTLDNGTPLDSASRGIPTHQSNGLANASLLLTTFQQAALTNIVSSQGDGSFEATTQISSTIAPGVHTIHAVETVTHRSASLPFTVALTGATATPTATPTFTPTATPTDTPTATPTTTPPPTLSCASPGTLALGPISELSSQTTSGTVTLCTSGSGTLTWRATWNQSQAPWLQMTQTSGTVQAPYEFQATISASAKNLSAGTYTANVTFIALESNTSVSVNITLTVKTGCVSSTPARLGFTGVAGTSNPAGSQNVSVTNCGLTSNWSASISGGSGWLSLNHTHGTLNHNASSTVTVTASNLGANLSAGTYQATITFTIGSDTSTVSVVLVVQPAPTISASPSSVDAYGSSCSNSGSNNVCTITLTNQSSVSGLTWSWSASASGVTVSGTSGTSIAASGTEQVTISVPASDCGNTVTVTFTAPGNSATVTWTCALIG